MESSFNSDSLLYNIVFLRSLILIPLAFFIYIFVVVYKQKQEKFKNKPLVQGLNQHK